MATWCYWENTDGTYLNLWCRCTSCCSISPLMRPTRVTISMEPDASGVPPWLQQIPICYGSIEQTKWEGVISLEMWWTLFSTRVEVALWSPRVSNFLIAILDSFITLSTSYVLMYFAAQAGLQSLFAQDCHEHPFGGEIRYRASARV